jgi:hypothetical protein
MYSEMVSIDITIVFKKSKMPNNLKIYHNLIENSEDNPIFMDKNDNK